MHSLILKKKKKNEKEKGKKKEMKENNPPTTTLPTTYNLLHILNQAHGSLDQGSLSRYRQLDPERGSTLGSTSEEETACTIFKGG